jgi:Zn-dependent protease with chaperone function
MTQNFAAWWLLQLALGGSLVLLAARLLMKQVPAPEARRRLGVIGVLSALLLAALELGPRWLPVTLPWPALAASTSAQASAASAALEPLFPEANVAEVPGLDLDVLMAAAEPGIAAAPVQAESPIQQSAQSPAEWAASLPSALVAAYAAVAGLFLLRWLLAHAALAWLMRGAKPAPASVSAILDELSPGRRWPLLVCPRVRVPFSYGLFRPTIVLPASMVDAPPRMLRWVLAHERTHLERGDGWVGLLLAVGQASFYFVPWFWWLRRQVRLCQEHVADAAAVAAGGRAEDYAEFLLGWVAAPRAPLVGTGVFGTSSDLYRRITVLLQGRPLDGNVSSRCWLAGAGVGLVSLAVVLAGLYVVPRAAAEPVRDDQKSAPKPQDKDSKDKKPPVPTLPDVEKMLKSLPRLPNDEQARAIRKQVEEMRKRIEEQAAAMRKRVEEQSAALRKRMAEQHAEMRRQFEQQQKRFGRMTPFSVRGRDRRLGAQLRAPEPALASQLDLPGGRGQVLVEVGANSPAARAGLKAHDVLLELSGKPVFSDQAKFSKLMDGVKPGTPVDVVVVRKGKKETIKGLTIPNSE